MSQQKKTEQKFLWLDLEMTGLEPEVHHIIELGLIVTDVNFNNLEHYETSVFQPPEVLELMDDWCVKTHGESGLSAKIPQSPPLTKVEMHVCALLDKHFSGSEKIILAGNSIGQDRKFIDRYMPALAKRLHYRMIDVSSFKEIFKHCYNIDFKKQNTHRALDDIKESIAEMQFFLSHIKGAPGKASV